MTRVEGLRLRSLRWLLLLALAALALFGVTGTPRLASAADQGPGGPILVISSPSSTFGAYYAEILRAEGLNEFAVSDASAINATTLAAYDLVVLAKMSLTSAQVSTLTTWVNGGGRLVAMAPDAQLSGLLGLTSSGTTLSDAYLLVNTAASPGNGIVGQTMQYHGAANRYTLNGATSIATLYSDATSPTSNPAVSLNIAGSGQAAAFAYDLATSVVQTRQGNPAWATQERDGVAPIRSDDKYYGNATGDVKPDWVDLSKVAIPQADEQQRLFANLVLQMNQQKKPLPRFWYLPNGKPAAVVMTGDDHGNGGTGPRFDQFKDASPANCSVANWECIRGTSYIYANTPLTDAQAAAYVADGFEISLHVNTNCADFTQTSLEDTYVQQLSDWQSKYASLPAPVTERHHCIVWSDWSTGAVVERNHGIRFDTSYYYWPANWINNVPGVFTGSAMPMRYSALDGTVLDVYQAVSQMTDESGQSYPFTINTLLDKATGPEGYYGVYTINAHTDVAASPEADATVSSAQAHGVPVVTSKQMLTWLDGRNGSSFGAFSWNGSALGFTITAGVGANGLQAMLPTRSGGSVLSALSRAGASVSYTVKTIKGVEYALFAAAGGSYVATYGVDGAAPTVVSTVPAANATGVSVSSAVSATFSEAMDPATINGNTVQLLGPSNSLVPATVTYDASTRRAVLTPSGPLAASTSYTATVKGGTTDPRAKDPAGNAVATFSWSFTTAGAPPCPCSTWNNSTTPANASVNDPGAVELGVKFRSDQNGYISGVRFYKGSANTGTHIGNLWSLAGQLLATATFSGESASGWQQVTFATPVAVTANTVYIASYYAPKGNYAADSLYFANAGVDNSPIHLLRDGESGGNGVYAYGSASSFPSQTYQSTNYWVDVVFSSTPPADTTPPTVSSTSPAAGGTNVDTGASVSATFSEALDASTVTASTFELRTAANAAVPASVAYNATTRTATLTPSAALSPSATYTAILHGGATDPRIKDAAGNALAANSSWSFTTAGTTATCSGSPNPIVAENCLAGNPSSEWDVSGAGDSTIQGYATQISVNRGTTVSFKVKSTASAYRFDIYRMGYYGGMGARKVATVQPSATLPQTQPNCLSDASTGLIDCGNWAVSGSWAVPATATTGIYFARLVRTDTGGASHIVFIVRDDASTSDMLFQTSDTTWQAYNPYGGNSLYIGAPGTNPSRAYKVSYNRPFTTRDNSVNGTQHDWVFNAEYPMVRWLEANGYNIAYITGVDTDRSAAMLRQHKLFLSVGHDEYWSGTQRANVEAARNAGMNLAFFSGNEVFWKTRWENSIDGTNTPYRTLVSYKETHANAKIDPTAAWTGTWRDPRFSPPADGGKPENALTGTIFMNNDTGQQYAITVPPAEGRMRLWRNTAVGTAAANGQTSTLPLGVLGYEFDSDLDNGSRPPGLVRMSNTTLTTPGVLTDYGSTYATGSVTHYLTLYKHTSGARVFGAGTIQWSWGLDATHDIAGRAADPSMQQATVNLFADMGVQPATLVAGLSAAAPSSDATAPTSAITAPAAGSNVQAGATTTITGTAADTGGGNVGGIEVSTDGGTTWHPAVGRESWTYTWTPSTTGSVTLKTRAVDDSGNIETPGAGTTVTVGARTCPCSIWASSVIPTTPSDTDNVSVNLGVKFRSDQAGFITGIRFYKGATNTGTHVGALWSSSGQQLAIATFSGETASGWQQVNFATPVAITANTVYVASYLAPNGHYAGDNGYFAASGTDSPPLHALQEGVSGSNGVYVYGAATAFPTASYQSTNYWVDVVFSTTGGGTGGGDTTPPTVTTVSPASAATQVSATTTVTATFSEAMDATTVSTSSFELRTAAGVLVPSTVAYNATTRVATLTPSAVLVHGTVYTATVKGGTTDPRVKDSAGNALAANRTWSFTVDSTAPTVSSTSPAANATGVSRTANITATFSEAMDATTISGSTFVLRDSAGNTVAAVVTYNATTRVVTLNPTPTLSSLATYTATIVGGAAGVKDVAGNPLAANRVWSFRTSIL